VTIAFVQKTRAQAKAWNWSVRIAFVKLRKNWRMKMLLSGCYIELTGVDVDYDTQPAQPASLTDPAFDAELELTSVMYNGVQIMDILSPSCLSELKSQAVAHEEAMNDMGNER
jgi:hypothetical protein